MKTHNDFLTTLRFGCRRVGLPPHRCLVAVSGGADSVALLRGLVALQAELPCELVVAHFDHRLRGDESAADAEWVRQLADDLKLPGCIGAAEAGERQPSGSAAEVTFDEDSARKQRYAFLERTAREQDCEVIVTAHTADDQAETVLHHLLRGTGVAGLRGIPWVRAVEVGSGKAEGESERSELKILDVVRPMLTATRDDVLSFLKSIGQEFRSDRTNADIKLTRNWLRHAILPELRQRWPQVTHALCRLADQADDLSATISQLAGELLDAALLEADADVVRLDVTKLADRPRHLVREMFVTLWHRRHWPLQAMGYEHWERLAELAASDGAKTLPGAIEARRRGNLLVLIAPTAG